MEYPLAMLIERAADARAALIDARHETAYRLFNGFYEGCPDLALDVYGATLVIHNYADDADRGRALAETATTAALKRLPWLTCVVVKTRASRDEQLRNGVVVRGASPATRIIENGVRYAVDVSLNRDTSLYLDTRNLRAWAKDKLAEKTVLNTFAYTGSLGVAALAGGARRVVQLDLNRAFLNMAKTSCTLNGFTIRKPDYVGADFWPAMNRLNRAGERFDCVIVDPPFFSATARGTVDLENNIARLINKVRPLINDGGWLVAINNALFESGTDYLRTLERLCGDGYLAIERLIPVPEDFTGYDNTRMGAPPMDPAPFNHPTKIAVLSVRRKADAAATSATLRGPLERREAQEQD